MNYPDEVLALLREFREEMRARLDRIERCLYGDGREGLVREVAKNSDFRERFEARSRLIFGAAISALFASLAALARSLVR